MSIRKILLLAIFLGLCPSISGSNSANFSNSRNKTSWNYTLPFVLEKELHTQLFNGYNAHVLPKFESGGLSYVMFHFGLLSLTSFDAKNQVLKVFGVVSMEWVDEQLAWESDIRHASIMNISVPANTIWTPDVVLFNTALKESKSHLDLYKTRPLIHKRGAVYWRIAVHWEVSCSSDVTWFPMDEQVCKLYFGSWTYDKYMLELLRSNEFYNDSDKLFTNKIFEVNSGEWKLESIKEEKIETNFDPTLNPYSTMVYTLELKRMSLFYFLYIIGPLLGLAFLFLFVFHLPHDSGERTGFGVTVILSITVYLLVISQKLPEKSDTVPFLGIGFVFFFFILCIALLISIFTIHSANFKTKPPRFLVAFLSFQICGCFFKKERQRNEAIEQAESVIEKIDDNEVDDSTIKTDKEGEQYATRSVVLDVNSKNERKKNKKLWKKQWRKISRKIEIWMFFAFLFILIVTTALLRVLF